MAKSVLLLRTLELLRTRPSTTIADLSAELERSERTVYRYLAELSYELHVPVYCHDGGYRLAARHDSPGGYGLNEEEALAVHVALSSTTASSASPFREAAQSALRKIESTLRNPAFDGLRGMQHKHMVAPSVFTDDRINNEVTALVIEALKSNRRLKILYRSQKSACVEEIVIDPYGLAFRRHNWYLVAHSHKHGRPVQLKMIRIQQAEATGETYERPEDFSLQRFYQNSWEVWAGGDETEVRVRFSPHVAPMIRENVYHPSQRLEDADDGGVILTVSVAGIEEIGSWVMGYGGDAEVLQPSALRERIRHSFLKALGHYQGKGKPHSDS